jgi:hypothetical protein
MWPLRCSKFYQTTWWRAMLTDRKGQIRVKKISGDLWHRRAMYLIQEKGIWYSRDGGLEWKKDSLSPSRTPRNKRSLNCPQPQSQVIRTAKFWPPINLSAHCQRSSIAFSPLNFATVRSFLWTSLITHGSIPFNDPPIQWRDVKCVRIYLVSEQGISLFGIIKCSGSKQGWTLWNTRPSTQWTAPPVSWTDVFIRGIATTQTKRNIPYVTWLSRSFRTSGHRTIMYNVRTVAQSQPQAETLESWLCTAAVEGRYEGEMM